MRHYDAESRLFLRVLSTLNEAQKRWFIGMKAHSLGRGGIQYLHELTSISRPTITKGLKEIKSQRELVDGERIRTTGGGRKRLLEQYPEITKDLSKIMEEATSGDPMSPILRNSGQSYQFDNTTKQGLKSKRSWIKRNIKLAKKYRTMK